MSNINLEIMKTERYITATLMVLVIGFTSIDAQRAKTNKSHENNKREQTEQQRSKVQRTDPKVQRQPARTRQTTSNVTRQPARTRQTTSNVTSQPARTRQTTSNVTRQPARTRQTTSNVQRQRTQTQEVTNRRRPVSISTTHNQRSTYRSPDSRVYARQNGNSNGRGNGHVKHNGNNNGRGHGNGYGNAHVKHNKYSTKRYYSGNHYHNMHPAGKIRVHYHHDTYVHNFNVLYYPAYHEIYWTHNMYRDYHRWYPNYHWRYDRGHRIYTISVFDAKYNMGEVAMVYGRVYATWYNRETDDYLLFFGGDYPNQQFTMVLPGRIARRFSWRPERYFLGEHLTVTGLITTFDGIPEIIVKNRRQVGLY